MSFPIMRLLRPCALAVQRHLRQREADALIVSGSEADVCVPATVLDAVDIGYRVIVVRDAVCRSSDKRHDMLTRLYHTRYTDRIGVAFVAIRFVFRIVPFLRVCPRTSRGIA
jgi:nicotinamidase-related amidase